MSKFTGHGGQVKRNGNLIGSIKTWQADQSAGTVYGSIQWGVSVEMYLDSELGLPVKIGDIFDLTLLPGRKAAWNIQLPNAKVETVSMGASREASTVQISMSCVTAK